MNRAVVETVVGFIVLITALMFLAFAYKKSGLSRGSNGYVVTANFQTADGIVQGGNVMLSGIKIGFVRDVVLDNDTFSAVVSININNHVKIPQDSKAVVATSGLLGEKYISIVPGSADKDLSAGGRIIYTRPSINLEELLGKLIYSFGSK